MPLREPDLRERSISALLLAAVAVLCLLTAAEGSGFWYSDGPRHALNGAFIHDLVRDRPFADPGGYATDYYLRYPALTVLFYPPLLHAFLAAAFGLLGTTAFAAHLTIAVFHFALLWMLWRLARRWLPAPYALGAALVAGVGPEVTLWARQVMLEVPSYFWIVVAVYAYLQWAEGSGRRWLVWTAVACVAAVYTKYTAGFIVVALLAEAVRWRRPALGDRAVLAVAAGVVVALLPALALLLTFGRANLESASGSQTTDLPRLSVQAWTFYLRALPQQLGWPALLLVPFGLVAVRTSTAFSRADKHLLAAWAVVAYVVFSAIALRDPRHTVMAMPPLAIVAMAALWRSERWAGAAARFVALAIGVGTAAWSIFSTPAATVEGHAAMARAFVERAAASDRVLFSGYYDGNFIFAMRELGARQRTVRADKLLVRMFLTRERGISDRGLDEAALKSLIERNALRYVVAERGFWSDLPSFAALDRLLRDRTLFEEVASVPITSTMNVTGELVLLRFTGPLPSPPPPLAIEMVGLGRSFESKAP